MVNAEQVRRVVQTDRATVEQACHATTVLPSECGEGLSGNLTLSDMLQNMRALLRIQVDCSISDEREACDAIAEHREVLRALRAQDPLEARAAMVSHMKTANQRLVEKDR